MGTKRQYDSGRVDSLGRMIKVSLSSVSRAIAGEKNKGNPQSDFFTNDEVQHRQLFQDTVDYLSTRELGDHTVTTFDDVIDHHEDTMKDVRSMVDSILDKGTTKQALDYMVHLGEDPVYLSLLESQKHYASLKDDCKEDLAQAKASVNTIVQMDTQPDENMIQRAAQHYRDTQKRLVDIDEEEKSLKELSHDYRNAIADLAGKVSQDRANTMETCEDRILGTRGLVSLGNFDSSQRQWMEMRQGSWGASDISTLLSDDPDDKKYKAESIRQIWESKLNPITEEDVSNNQKAHQRATDAISRGHLTEAFIADMYNSTHDDVDLVHAPHTYKSPHIPIHINYDFLMKNKDTGKIDGNFEIKTSQDPSKWGDPDSGIDGIPTKYRIQSLVQARMAGFPRGALGVMINQNELSTYHFEMTPALEREADRYISQAEKEWERLEQAKKDGYTSLPPSSKGKVYKGFEQYILKPGIMQKGKYTKESAKADSARTEIFKNIAALRGRNPRDYQSVKQEFELSMQGKQWVPANVSDALEKLYSRSDFSRTTGVSVDVETGGYSSNSAPIISCGVAEVNIGTGEVSSEERYFGMSDRASKAFKGTGMQDVHRITPEKIAGLPQAVDNSSWFTDRIKGNVFIHNAPFDDAVLSQVEGYLESKMRGDIRVHDTVKFAKYFSASPRNSLDAVAKQEGVELGNHHNAQEDAHAAAEVAHAILSRVGQGTKRA